VRREAAHVFGYIKPEEFALFRELSLTYTNSIAILGDSSRFFSAIEVAQCPVDDIAIAAAEQLIRDIATNGNSGGRRSLDLHHLDEILKREYASSEHNPPLRRRLLDLIDSMISLELYDLNSVIQAHDRSD
jgi:hypothetical protein